MRMYLKHAVLVSALVLFASAGGAAAEQDFEGSISCEPGAGGIAVTVETGGCTAKADFAVSSTAALGKTEIGLRRAKADTCKGNFPDGLKLQFSWSDLKLSPGSQYVLTNPMLPGAAGKQACAGTVPGAAAVAAEARPAKVYRQRRHKHRHYRPYQQYQPYRQYRHHYRRHQCECYCPCACGF